MIEGSRVTLGGEVANYYRGLRGTVLSLYKEVEKEGPMGGWTHTYRYLARVELDNGEIVTVYQDDLRR